MKRLTKNSYDKVIFGVAGGIAKYFNIDPIWIRLAWAVLFFAFGIGIVSYLVAALIIPND